MKNKKGLFFVILAFVLFAAVIIIYINKNNNVNSDVPNDNKVNVSEEELELMQDIISNNDLYKYAGSYVRNVYYANKEISVNEISNYEFIDFAIEYNRMKNKEKVCNTSTEEKPVEEIKQMIKELYGPDLIYQVPSFGVEFTYENEKFKIHNNNCDNENYIESNDFILTNIIKKDMTEEEITFYQKIAYVSEVIFTDENNSVKTYYSFYKDFDSDKPVYEKIEVSAIFNQDITSDKFSTYIFKFKKASDGKYYFYSSEPLQNDK